PAQQLLPEIFDLKRVHKLFIVARTIVRRQLRAHHSPQTPIWTAAEYMNRVALFQPPDRHITTLIQQAFCDAAVTLTRAGASRYRADRWFARGTSCPPIPATNGNLRTAPLPGQ